MDTIKTNEYKHWMNVLRFTCPKLWDLKPHPYDAHTTKLLVDLIMSWLMTPKQKVTIKSTNIMMQNYKCIIDYRMG